MAWKPEYFVIHHTVTPNDFRQLTRMEMKRAYHGVIHSSGQWRVSVPHNRPSVRAVYGANRITFSIALLGNFMHDQPTEKALKTLEQILVAKMRKFGYGKKDVWRIMSHNDCFKRIGSRYRTACCGTYLQKEIHTLRDSVSRYLI